MIVMAEGSETPGGGSGSGAQSGGLGAEGRGRGTEGDLLAERRARRAVESGDAALIRRAEAAEATVRTLEAHLASLQQRLAEAEAERRRIAEHGEVQQAPPAIERRPSGEQELRRAKQREYAEQQLRLEAEDRSIDLERRGIDLERESRLEIERLGRRLSTSERDARALSGQLEAVQRELAEAEQAAASELASARRVEKEFQARLAELERRALELHEDLEVERAARMRSEQLLERMRLGYRRLVGVVRELRGVVARLAVATAPAPAPVEPASERLHREDPAPRRLDASAGAWSASPSAHREEMTEALAAAVERLRARVEDVGGDVGQPAASAQPPQRVSSRESPEGLGAAGAKRPPHRHTMSWLRRRSIRRKQRRARRAAAAGAPSMQSQ